MCKGGTVNTYSSNNKSNKLASAILGLGFIAAGSFAPLAFSKQEAPVSSSTASTLDTVVAQTPSDRADTITFEKALADASYSAQSSVFEDSLKSLTALGTVSSDSYVLSNITESPGTASSAAKGSSKSLPLTAKSDAPYVSADVLDSYDFVENRWDSYSKDPSDRLPFMKTSWNDYSKNFSVQLPNYFREYVFENYPDGSFIDSVASFAARQLSSDSVNVSKQDLFDGNLANYELWAFDHKRVQNPPYINSTDTTYHYVNEVFVASPERVDVYFTKSIDKKDVNDVFDRAIHVSPSSYDLDMDFLRK